MNRVNSDILLLIVTFCAAAGWIFSKTALTEISPFWFIGSRFLIAALVLSLFCFKQIKRLSSQEYSYGLLTGLLFGLAMMTWIQGLHMSKHVGEASFIVSLGVMFVPFFAALFLKETLPKTLILSIPLAISGLACLNLQNQLNQHWQWEPAQIVLLTAAVLFALQFTLTSFLTKSIDPVLLTCIQLFVAGMLAIITALLTETAPKDISNNVLYHLLAAAILASSFRFYLQTLALKYALASHAGMILLLEPIWVTFLGIFFLQEKLNYYQLSGCSLIFLALLINRLLKVKT